MLEASLDARGKQQVFRDYLQREGIVEFPGAYNAMTAMLITQHGFDGVYVSGSVVAADLGLPDIGLTSLSELSHRASEIARMTNLPVIADADTGFGEPMNAARTIQIMEDAGVSAVHLEDQVNPKRCGHLDGKEVVPADVAVRRISAAVVGRRDPDFAVIARSDSRAVEGFDGMLTRLEQYVQAGADVVVPEALQSLEEFEKVSSTIGVPVLANMTEFGKSPLWTRQELQDAGVKIVIYPVSLQRIALGAVERALESLATEGSLASQVPHMQTRARLYQVLDYEGYNSFDDSIFSFRVGEE